MTLREDTEMQKSISFICLAFVLIVAGCDDHARLYVKANETNDVFNNEANSGNDIWYNKPDTGVDSDDSGSKSDVVIMPDVKVESDVEIDSDTCATERRLFDEDQDGYGDPANYIEVCPSEPWEDGFVQWIEGRVDCDDGDTEIHPEAQEICDGLDNDCDGEIDEIFRTGSCYVGDGACRQYGEMACQPDGTNTCSNEQGIPIMASEPEVEICGDGIDQDCDGEDDACMPSIQVAESTPPSDIILGDMTHVVVSTYELRSARSDIVVTEIELENCLGEFVQSGICGEDYGIPGNDEAVTEVMLLWHHGETPVLTVPGTLSQGRVRFQNIHLNFQDNSPLLIEILVNTNSVNENNGAQSGSVFELRVKRFRWHYLDTNLDSEIFLNQDNGQPNAFIVAKTKPTVSIAAETRSGAVLSPGFMDVIRFNVSASSYGDVNLKQLLFKLTTSSQLEDWRMCETLSNPLLWTLVDTNDIGLHLDPDDSWSFLNANGNECQPGEEVVYGKLDLRTTPIIIDAGTRTQFGLWMQISAPQTPNYTVHIDIPSESDMVNIPPPHMSFRWSDGFQDFDGYYLQSLPVIGGTLIF